jgi:hypothetical protein
MSWKSLFAYAGFDSVETMILVADAQWRFFHFFTRVSIAIQFTPPLPPSVENDCSNLQDSGLMSEMMKRTRTGKGRRQKDEL